MDRERLHLARTEYKDAQIGRIKVLETWGCPSRLQLGRVPFIPSKARLLRQDRDGEA